MGGKKRHSQDRMYITATEWKNEYGGKKNHTGNKDYRPLPFDHCALSLSQFQDPVCTEEGVMFDFVSLAEFIKKYGKNPISGEPMSAKDVIRLHMAKNADGQWHCPVTFKTFNNNSCIAAIKTTGNVFALEAVKELNITPKNYTDLLTGEPFKRSDIIILQDPSNPDISAKRDINGFEHLKQIRAASSAARASESTVRHNPTTSTIMEEMNRKQKEELENPTAKSNPALLTSKITSTSRIDDVRDILALNPTIDEVCPGRVVTDQKAGGSLTSTSQEVSTLSTVKMATAEDIREARWRMMRQVGKKGYVQMQTNVGNLNVEIHCDWAQRTSWNFLTLCEREYYNETIFHRSVPGFIIQGGDPTGTGTGGDSAFGGTFKDEFDSRLIHDSRGILSMANSGGNTNKSQFFVTYAPATHLDYKHCVFGRVVGGNAVLDRMEAVEADKNAVPTSEIKILSMHVMVNPIPEADSLLVEQIHKERAAKNENILGTRTLLGRREALQIPDGAVERNTSVAVHPAITIPNRNPGQGIPHPAGIPTQSRTSQISAVVASSSGVDVSRAAGDAGASARASTMSQADKIAAFMRSQGGEIGTTSTISNPLKKKKIGGDFSGW